MSEQSTTAQKPMEKSDPIQFVQGLELAPSDSTESADVQGKLPPSDKAQGYVESESSVSFTKLLTGQNKADILNSLLLAKLAANKKYNCHEKPMEWYGFYKNVLQHIGWVIQDFHFQKHTSSSASLTMNKVVHELLAPIACADQRVVLEKSLKELQALSMDNPRMLLFYKCNDQSKTGNFQFQLCTKGSGGQVLMILGSFYFKSKVKCDRFLSKEFHSRDIDLEHAVQTITLDAAAYAAVRKEIVDKLSKYPNSFMELF